MEFSGLFPSPANRIARGSNGEQFDLRQTRSCASPEKGEFNGRWYSIAPLAPLVAAVASGIVADRFVHPWGMQVWLTIATASGIAATLVRHRNLVSSLAVLAAFVGLGGGWHHFRWWDVAPNDLSRSVTETSRPAWLRGVVREVLGARRGVGFAYATGGGERVTTRFVLDVTALCDGERWSRVSGRAIVSVEGDRTEIRAGQAIEAAGQIARVPGPLNPGEFDYRAYLQAQGIRLRLTVDERASVWRVPGGGDVLSGWMGNLRSWSRALLVERLDPSIAPLAAGLLLGQREGMDPEINDAFARTGTTHLIAISGLQLQVLAGALLLVFRLVGLPRRPAHLAVGLGTAAYALLVGLAPSVVRSTVMTLTFCLAALAQRMVRPANTLALAALATLSVNPAYLFDIGCQLSFLAIGALIWLAPLACVSVRRAHKMIRIWVSGPVSPLDELERKFEPWWRTALRRTGASLFDGAVASTVVWLAALPLVALRFHLVSPIAILLNIPLIPLTSAALLLGGFGLAVSAVLGPLGNPFCLAAGWLLQVTESIVRWGVGQPWGHRFVVGPSLGWVLVFYGLLGLATMWAATGGRLLRFSTGLLSRGTVWGLVVAWIIPGWLLAGDRARPKSMVAEVLAVGHGLAVVIQTPDGQTLLYDCGRLGDPSVGRRIIAPALWTLGVNRIETVLLSHADQDHYDGLPDLLERFQIGAVRVSPGFAGPTNPGAIQLLAQIRSHGIPVQTITAPESWENWGARFSVWHPRAGWYPEARDNARSLVLDVAYAGRHLLLTGDLEQPGLDELVARPLPEPPPDVLVAPHHGGRSANPTWFYEWARPRLVLVSQRALAPGTNDALSSLERQGVPLVRTWCRGAVRLQWSPDGIRVRGFLEENGAENIPANLLRTLAAIRGSDGVHHIGIGLLGFAIGAIAFVLIAVIEFGSWALVVPPRLSKNGNEVREDPASPRRETTVESIQIRARDGARLAGRWIPACGPDATGRTVLLLHGFAELSTDVENHRVAVLNAHGWNVAVLDSRGHGQSDGPYGSFGAREAEDVRAWLDVLVNRMARPEPRLAFRPVLWGRSVGAGTAIRAAAQDSRIEALVLESAFVDLNAVVAAVLRRRRLPFSSLLARTVIRRAGKLAGVPLGQPRPIDVAPRVMCPTLLVHGTDDMLVPVGDARRLADAFPLAPQWLDVARAGHTDVIDIGGEVILEQIVGFLERIGERLNPEKRT